MFVLFLVFDSISFATAVQRLVIEASCLLHSTADAQTLPAWRFKTSVHCSGSAGVERAVSRCFSHINIFCFIFRINQADVCVSDVTIGAFMADSVVLLRWVTVSFTVTLQYVFRPLSHFDVHSLPHCVPVSVCVVVGPGLSLRWTSPSSCPSPSTSLFRSATRATRT